MKRSLYFELCAYAFFQVLKRYKTGKKEFNSVKRQVGALSKTDRFFIIDMAAQQWIRKRKLKKDFNDKVY